MRKVLLFSGLAMLFAVSCMQQSAKNSKNSDSATLMPDTLAQKPPMGWNSWNCYGSDVTEEQVKANAE